ncbi:MAG: hypothetical protein ACI97A_004328, partial [Planctomycetota bacterium]
MARSLIQQLSYDKFLMCNGQEMALRDSDFRLFANYFVLGACLADFILEHSMRPQRLRTFATSMVVLALTSSFAMAQFTL